jgi:[acyl-carrier-protein] S-malonyltransferase
VRAPYVRTAKPFVAPPTHPRRTPRSGGWVREALNNGAWADNYHLMSDTSATAILFPGQGSHGDGMRELVERHEPALAELAIALVGDDPYARAGDATRFAQPAILSASLAAYTAAGRPAAAYLSGHSLGELSALAAAGAIRPDDAVRLAVERGRLTDEAARGEPGGMVAILGDQDVARELAAANGLTVANDNGPTQLVLAGREAALEAATAEAKPHGVKAMRLAVDGAFHSPAIEPAVAPFREVLDGVEVTIPDIPVLSCSRVTTFDSADQIRAALAEALVRPVRWRETMEELHRRGVRRFLETGPGKALTGMVRRAGLDDVEASVLETREAAHA